MREAYIDTRAWYDRIERQARGKYSTERRNTFYRSVHLAFEFLDKRYKSSWLDHLDLLHTYQAFVQLQEFCTRDEERGFNSIIHELTEELFYRMKGLIPPEMSKGYFVEEPKRKALRLFVD